jgi:hypothetical protein
MNLVNDHFAQKAFNLLAGLFRYVCANGMTVSAGASTTRVIHRGNVQVTITESLQAALTNLTGAQASIEDWKAIDLSNEQQHIYASGVSRIRLGENQEGINPDRFLQARRSADQGNDLWRVFNRAQENVIRGGVRPATKRLRGITSVNTDIDLNQKLWEYTKGFAAAMKSARG